MSRVSIVIPAHNAAGFLRDALDSVFAQRLEDPEVVVVDDGSTDGTADAARRYGRGVQVLSQPRSGSGRARNQGLQATSGDLVAFLDADDIWVPEKSSLQIPLLENDPDLGLVFSDMVSFGGEGAPSRRYFEERGFDGRCTPSSIFLYDMISTPTVILRRSCLDEAGLFDESLPIGQDTDLWFRVALARRFAVVDLPTVRRRLHADNITRDSRLLARCVVEIWGRYLDRCIEREPGMKRRLLADLALKRRHHFLLEGCSLLNEGHPREARRFLAGAIREAPMSLRPYVFYLSSFLRAGAPRRRSPRISP
jgi:glycosyltransferase involved in cell wall biosynthesis